MKYLVIFAWWALAVAIGMAAVYVIYVNFGEMWALVWLGGVSAAVQWNQNRHERGHRG